MNPRPQSRSPLGIPLGLVLALCLAGPAVAGIVFTQEIRGEGEATELQNMTLRTSIDTGGDNEKPMITTMEVTELSEEKVPASVFAIPAGYTETEMMAPNMRLPDMNQPR